MRPQPVARLWHLFLIVHNRGKSINMLRLRVVSTLAGAVLTLAPFSAVANPAAGRARETETHVVIATPKYDMAITRDGFGIQIRRDGAVILESAQPGDPLTNLAFTDK